MRQSRAEFSLLLFASLTAGCALEPGQPWGVAEFSLAAGFAPEASRLDARGRLKTSSNYLLELEDLSAKFGALVLRLRTSSAGASAFDPANPPPGYSLCHNGHCHATDGRLVDYADIEAEISDSPSPQLSLAVTATITQLVSAPLEVTLSPCPGDCVLERGALSELSLSVQQVWVRGRVFDRQESPESLPPEGVPFSTRLDLDAEVSTALTGAVDRGEAVGLRVPARFDFPPSAFDGVDFSALVKNPDDDVAFKERLKTNLEESEALSASLSRFNR